MLSTVGFKMMTELWNYKGLRASEFSHLRLHVSRCKSRVDLAFVWISALCSFSLIEKSIAVHLLDAQQECRQGGMSGI
ncbi:hypothetical protein C1J03_12350 [Sulfitobacter sp. SK012]|nr:hypothetical protein C1J03_12350 [Sulfitobacter sp. SK012]